MHDFCEEEVNLLSVSLRKTKEEVEFKDEQEFGRTKIRTYWSQKTLVGSPKGGLPSLLFLKHFKDR